MSFLARRLRQRERELGFAMRAHFERCERPPERLRREHADIYAQLLVERRTPEWEET